ncbi:MAG TPA: alkaline phosphatase family protein [Thermomicrobiales bacterium]|jgi:uncharacterized membrane protein YvlD (DUF360 family)
MVFRIGHFVVVTIVQGLLVLLLAGVLSGVHVENAQTAIVGTAVIVAVTGFLWPYIYEIAARARPILFPVLVFALTGGTVLAVSALLAEFDLHGLRIDGLGAGIAVAVAVAAANTLLAALFADDDRTYERYVIKPVLRANAGQPHTDVPGLLLLEVDGLAEPVLRRALAEGRMPTLQGWLDSGSHRLTHWEPDLSSQTAASQAGILLGRNDDIPAFRWYDRATGQVLVSSKAATAALVEQRLSTGNGLLAASGASRCNMFSGDAPDCLLTFSAIGRRGTDGAKPLRSSRSYYLFFANPFTVTRLIVLFVYDIFLEIFERLRQILLRVRPRVHRGGIYPFVRAFATAAGPEMDTYMVISDVAHGVPALYATYYAYDEVAHHSGILSPDVMGVLRRLDRHFSRIERATQTAPRPYHIVILSDHGQSNGATFLQRYGESLGQLVDRLTPADYRVVRVRHGSEVEGHLDAALAEGVAQGTRGAGFVKRFAGDRTANGKIDNESTNGQPIVVTPGTAAREIVVLASGNLGLIYFTDSSRRMTREEIDAAFPGLLSGLTGHEGIGFVRVHSECDGPIALGPNGAHFLTSGRVEGADPLVLYGPNAAGHLLRHDGFENTPDILVNSRYWSEADEVAAFEELVGSHGGLGGTQARPFVLHPAALPMETEPIVGTAALHAVLKQWAQATVPVEALEEKMRAV